MSSGRSTNHIVIASMFLCSSVMSGLSGLGSTGCIVPACRFGLCVCIVLLWSVMSSLQSLAMNVSVTPTCSSASATSLYLPSSSAVKVACPWLSVVAVACCVRTSPFRR